jgi:hypothetical protein
MRGARVITFHSSASLRARREFAVARCRSHGNAPQCHIPLNHRLIDGINPRLSQGTMLEQLRQLRGVETYRLGLLCGTNLYSGCPASTTLSPRIAAPHLLLSVGSLPHSKCYRREAAKGGSPEGGDEETDNIGYTTGTNSDDSSALQQR